MFGLVLLFTFPANCPRQHPTTTTMLTFHELGSREAHRWVNRFQSVWFHRLIHHVELMTAMTVARFARWVAVKEICRGIWSYIIATIPEGWGTNSKLPYERWDGRVGDHFWSVRFRRLIHHIEFMTAMTAMTAARFARWVMAKERKLVLYNRDNPERLRDQ